MRLRICWAMGPAKAGVLLAGGLISAWLAASCGSTEGGLACGEGTVQQGSLCVLDRSRGSGGAGSGSSSSSSSSSSSGAGGMTGDPNLFPTPVGQQEIPSASIAAQQYFVQNVYPALMDPNNVERCSNCHAVGVFGAPNFLASSADKAYKLVREYNSGALAAVPEANLLLNKGRHEGPALNSFQRAAITEWLKLEYPNRPLPLVIKTLFDALANFANCMSKDEFVQQGLGTIPLTPLADNAAVNCTLCHSSAQAKDNGGGFILDKDPAITFDNLKKFPGILKLVEPLPGPTGTFSRLQDASRLPLKGLEPNRVDLGGACASATTVDVVLGGGIINVFAPDYCHPNYDIGQSLEDKLQIFISNAMNRANNQICAPGLQGGSIR